MPVSPHPSVKPTSPRKPPATSTTQGTVNKVSGSGGSDQAGVNYGFGGSIKVSDPSKSERAGDITSTNAKPGSQNDSQM